MTRSVSEKRDYAPSRPASPAKTRATEGEASQDGACDTAIRIAYGAAAAGFVAYAVWGTLFPFDFHAVPLETAALLFWSQWATDAGSLSFTDLVSNVLLFLPIGLFMSAALDRSWPGKRGLTPFSTTRFTLAAEIGRAHV